VIIFIAVIGVTELYNVWIWIYARSKWSKFTLAANC